MKRLMLAILVLLPVIALCGCERTGTPPTAPVAQRSYVVRVLGPSSNPLPGASVMIETVGQKYVRSTDNSGVATIQIPNSVALPSHVVVVATHASIMPEALTCPGGASVTASPTIPTVAMPRTVLVRDVFLHHLGNDRYDGSPNSQHQLPSEGVELSYSFWLGSVPSRMPVIRLFARGIEHPTQIKINGMVVNRLPDSAIDGSLTVYTFSLSGVPLSYLRPGNNVVSIQTADFNPSDPYDDIEFCGLMLFYP